MVYVVYFSPGGTTLRTLKLIAEGMNVSDAVEIDMSKPVNRARKWSFAKDDVVLYGTITGATLFALNKEIFATFEGNGARFVGVGLYGNLYYGVVLRQLNSRATRRGFRVMALAASVGQHSSNSHVGEGRPDGEDAKRLVRFGREVAQKAERGQTALAEPIPIGWSPLKLYNMVVAVRKMQSDDTDYTLPALMKTKVIDTAECIECGKCERDCPVGAIDIATKHFDLQKCIACNRCINHCPKQVISSTSKIMWHVVKDFTKRYEGYRAEPTFVL